MRRGDGAAKALSPRLEDVSDSVGVCLGLSRDPPTMWSKPSATNHEEPRPPSAATTASCLDVFALRRDSAAVLSLSAIDDDSDPDGACLAVMSSNGCVEAEAGRSWAHAAEAAPSWDGDSARRGDSAAVLRLSTLHEDTASVDRRLSRGLPDASSATCEASKAARPRESCAVAATSSLLSSAASPSLPSSRRAGVGAPPAASAPGQRFRGMWSSVRMPSTSCSSYCCCCDCSTKGSSVSDGCSSAEYSCC
mmetsp:Transcript_70079/g.203153  ORF Transcript_70079/g.203153 Transcript_70079/m.203153 type:complete len:250 (+) Transcript_70079:824-1573(+)